MDMKRTFGSRAQSGDANAFARHDTKSSPGSFSRWPVRSWDRGAACQWATSDSSRLWSSICGFPNPHRRLPEEWSLPIAAETRKTSVRYRGYAGSGRADPGSRSNWERLPLWAVAQASWPPPARYWAQLSYPFMLGE